MASAARLRRGVSFAGALLGQAEGVIASVTADGAYDGEPTCVAVAARQRHPPPEVVVPPRASAVPSSNEGNSARSLPAQPGEVAIAAAVLNTMIRTAKPAAIRVA